MIEHEVAKSVEVLNLKVLRLITPERAARLGVSTEGPVFISTSTSSKFRCLEKDCNVYWGPLIYQAGYKVEAHHFHQGRDGGIYFYGYRDILAGYFNHLIQAFGSGWIAIVEPASSEVGFDRGGGGRRAKEVAITKIRAFCVDEYCMSGPKSREISQGFVVPGTEAGRLQPICSLERHPEYASRTRYNFQITEEGEVLFSEIQQEFPSGNY